MTGKAKKIIIPPAEDLIQMSKYFVRLKGTRPMLNLYPADTKLSTVIRECAAEWFNKDQRIIFNADIDDFLRQLFEAFADKDVKTTAILTDIKKHSGMGYQSGGVSGINKYHSDKSRVDSRMIRRKRR